MGQGLANSTYLVLNQKDEIVFESKNIFVARDELHRLRDGSRLIRDDGVVLAFMASGGSAKVRKQLSKKTKQLLKLIRTATG